MWAIKYFRPYLSGRKYILVTEHRTTNWLYLDAALDWHNRTI